MKKTSEIFLVQARHCLRCGGLLTSKQAVADGYGHVCKLKANKALEARKPIKNQLSLFQDDNNA